MSRGKKILLIILFLLIGLIILGYYGSAGFTKKQKYEKCAKTCEEWMFNESNIPLCKTECENVTGYTPVKSKANERPSTKTETPKPKTTTPVPKTTTTSPTTVPQDEVSESQPESQQEYYCRWVWPQIIIKKDTDETVMPCPSSKPWCYYGNKTFEDMACCEQYDKESDTKLNCTPLSELLQK